MECQHWRVRPYHGSYVSQRCPDCGRYVKGIWNKTTGYRDLYVVPEEEVTRAIAWVVARKKGTEETIRGLLLYHGPHRKVYLQEGMNLHNPNDYEIIEQEPIDDGENPWVGVLPVR